MSQPSVAAYFSTRKRAATDDLRSKAKVLILEQEQSRTIDNRTRFTENTKNEISQSNAETNSITDSMKLSPKLIRVSAMEIGGPSAPKSNSAVRNIQFDSPKSNAQKTQKSHTRLRATRSQKFATQDCHADIRQSILRMNDDAELRKVPFSKKGTLSPRKKPATPKKEKEELSIKNEPPAAGALTPKKMSTMERLAAKDLTLNEIKSRINKSSRLAELKASIARIRNCEQKLEELHEKDDTKTPHIRKFNKIQLEIPVSPQKACKSPTKTLLTPTKKRESEKTMSPQRRLLFEPKEAPASPIKGSPTKTPAYQKYLSIAESGTPALPLPYAYRFLAEAFRCVDTVTAMLFNRKELITFKKLKPAVQELLRRNFTLDHLAQIKTIFPDAFTYHQEKHRSFGSASKQDKYDLVLVPIVEAKSGRNTPDADNILQRGSETSMGPTVLLERKRKFYNVLLGRVKDDHEKFLLQLDPPMVIKKENILRWHPEFDVETCTPIELAELPLPPDVQKETSAKNILDKAKNMFNCGTRMEKALQRLADANMTSKSGSCPSSVTDNDNEDGVKRVEISVVDTPPATPTTQNSYLTTAFKGIPKALLEKVRAKQAAKALEAMTRTSDADKEAALYSRLPELAKVLRNIFVAEKKGVLTLEFVINKLDNSFRTRLTPNEFEEHIRLLCKLLPTWTSVHCVRQVDYLKLARDVDLTKIIKRLEIMANDKVTTS